MSQVVEAPVEAPRRSTEDDPVEDHPWVVIVWNDPINLNRRRVKTSGGRGSMGE